MCGNLIVSRIPSTLNAKSEWNKVRIKVKGKTPLGVIIIICIVFAVMTWHIKSISHGRDIQPVPTPHGYAAAWIDTTSIKGKTDDCVVWVMLKNSPDGKFQQLWYHYYKKANILYLDVTVTDTPQQTYTIIVIDTVSVAVYNATCMYISKKLEE